MGMNFSCSTEGRTRYNQTRWLRARGTVNAVPDSCSAYRPYGHCEGRRSSGGGRKSSRGDATVHVSARGNTSRGRRMAQPSGEARLVAECRGEACGPAKRRRLCSGESCCYKRSCTHNLWPVLANWQRAGQCLRCVFIACMCHAPDVAASARRRTVPPLTKARHVLQAPWRGRGGREVRVVRRRQRRGFRLGDCRCRCHGYGLRGREHRSRAGSRGR